MTARRAPSLSRCTVGLTVVLCLSSSSAFSQDAPEEPPEGLQTAPAERGDVPEELPPLDESLLGLLGGDEAAAAEDEPWRDVVLHGDGRLRFELDESRDRQPFNDLQLGLSLTGRVGLTAPVGDHSATLVIGDGRRVGQDFGTLPLPIVDPIALGFLYEAHLDVDVSGLFVPARLALGRMPVQVADGRWVGRADFDPRGRTFDGVLLVHASPLLTAQAGGFWLGPLVPGDVAPPSFLAVTEIARETGWYEVSSYLLAHRDGTPARTGASSLSLFTLGGRARFEAPFGAALRVGADGQVPLSDEAGLAPAGFGAHVEGALRYAPTLSAFEVTGTPFVELSGEWTGGEPVLGRRFRAPGPTVHRYLGVLDVAVADNVMSAALAAGIATREGLLAMAEARVLALSDPKGPLFDPTGRALIAADPRRQERYALTEVDVVMRVPVGRGAYVEGEYGVGFPGPAFTGGTTPIQRLLLSVAFSLDASR